MVFAMCNANAQTYIPPGFPELIMPTNADNAIAPKLYNTSSYSCQQVSFNVDSLDAPNFKDMNLFVYAWSSYNMGIGTGNGLSFVRVNSVTGATEHKHFIPIHPDKHFTEVGIIQGDDKKVYIITLWNGDWVSPTGLKIGTFYDLYEWLPSSLNLVSEANQINTYQTSLFNSSKGHRVSMDVSQLKRVVFCWEEDYKSVVNKGGVFVKLMKVEGPAPFLVTPNIRFNVDSANHYPDVSFGKVGEKIRVAYRKHSSPAGSIFYDLNIESTLTTSFLSMPFVPPTSPVSYTSLYSSPFITESSLSSFIQDGTPAPLLKNDQISLDCPEGSTDDLWSVVVARDPYKITAVIKHPTGLITKLLTSSIGIRYFHPVVAYDNTGSIPNINYVWFDDSSRNYIGTILTYTGAYIPPLTSSTFLIVNNEVLEGSNYEPFRPTISRNNKVEKFFIAYPGSVYPTFHPDMRCKWVNAPTIPFVDKHNNLSITTLPNIVVSPNPFVNDLKVEITNYNHEPITWSLIDNQGRAIIGGSSEKLDYINQKLQTNSSSLATGIYYLQLHFNGNTNNFKLIKQ